jgi:hypothetical protein
MFPAGRGLQASARLWLFYEGRFRREPPFFIKKFVPMFGLPVPVGIPTAR